MKSETLRIRICPRCGARYGRQPALSRTDGITLICPDCGTREALESIGVGTEPMANDKYLFVVSGAAGTGKDSVVVCPAYRIFS